MIYPNDHPPAHVHVIAPDWVVVIDLIDGEVRELICGSERDASRALRLVIEHHQVLMRAWRRIHG